VVPLGFAVSYPCEYLDALADDVSLGLDLTYADGTLISGDPAHGIITSASLTKRFIHGEDGVRQKPGQKACRGCTVAPDAVGGRCPEVSYLAGMQLGCSATSALNAGGFKKEK
jgi:hypothetical protein